MNQVPPRVRTYGFRISRSDVVVLLVAGVAAGMLWPINRLCASITLIVVGHFFLFCNVIRLHRKWELLWAAIFVANATVWWGLWADLRVWPVLVTQLPVTIVLIAIQMRSRSYRGIGAQRLNPHLQEALTAPR
jgi:hypothetical protein